ncbi:MAG: hypothetical protein ACHQQQ_09475 [Bacteroidota bacterium]
MKLRLRCALARPLDKKHRDPALTGGVRSSKGIVHAATFSNFYQEQCYPWPTRRTGCLIKIGKAEMGDVPRPARPVRRAARAGKTRHTAGQGRVEYDHRHASCTL